MSNISIVIGSWGSYNECNERALGSNWLDLSDYTDWNEIEEELTKQGFELNGIDEELFVQDIEGLNADLNWDYTHPKNIFDVLLYSGVLENNYKYKVMDAYLQVRSWEDFESLVDSYGYNWDSDIILHENQDWADYGKEYLACCCYDIPDEIEQFIDFEEYGRYLGQDCAEEYDDGIIEIR